MTWQPRAHSASQRLKPVQRCRDVETLAEGTGGYLLKVSEINIIEVFSGSLILFPFVSLLKTGFIVLSSLFPLIVCAYSKDLILIPSAPHPHILPHGL